MDAITVSTTLSALRQLVEGQSVLLKAKDEEIARLRKELADMKSTAAPAEQSGDDTKVRVLPKQIYDKESAMAHFASKIMQVYCVLRPNGDIVKALVYTIFLNMQFEEREHLIFALIDNRFMIRSDDVVTCRASSTHFYSEKGPTGDDMLTLVGAEYSDLIMSGFVEVRSSHSITSLVCIEKTFNALVRAGLNPDRWIQINK